MSADTNPSGTPDIRATMEDLQLVIPKRNTPLQQGSEVDTPLQPATIDVRSLEQLNSLDIGQFTQVRSVVMQGNEYRGNQLSTLSDSIGQLTQLTTLDLRGNQLSTLPDSIGELAQLTTLYLSRNRLLTLPDCIGQLAQLTTLDLSLNKNFEELDQMEMKYKLLFWQDPEKLVEKAIKYNLATLVIDILAKVVIDRGRLSNIFLIRPAILNELCKRNPLLMYQILSMLEMDQSNCDIKSYPLQDGTYCIRGQQNDSSFWKGKIGEHVDKKISLPFYLLVLLYYVLYWMVVSMFRLFMNFKK